MKRKWFYYNDIDFMCENNSKLFEVLEMIEDDIEINDEDIDSEQFFSLKGAGVTNE